MNGKMEIEFESEKKKPIFDHKKFMKSIIFIQKFWREKKLKKSCKTNFNLKNYNSNLDACNLCDPITLDALPKDYKKFWFLCIECSTKPIVYAFEPDSLAESLEISMEIKNPVTKRDLNKVEIMRLLRLCKNKYPFLSKWLDPKKRMELESEKERKLEIDQWNSYYTDRLLSIIFERLRHPGNTPSQKIPSIAVKECFPSILLELIEFRNFLEEENELVLEMSNSSFSHISSMCSQVYDRWLNTKKGLEMRKYYCTVVHEFLLRCASYSDIIFRYKIMKNKNFSKLKFNNLNSTPLFLNPIEHLEAIIAEDAVLKYIILDENFDKDFKDQFKPNAFVKRMHFLQMESEENKKFKKNDKKDDKEEDEGEDECEDADIDADADYQNKDSDNNIDIDIDADTDVNTDADTDVDITIISDNDNDDDKNNKEKEELRDSLSNYSSSTEYQSDGFDGESSGEYTRKQ